VEAVEANGRVNADVAFELDPHDLTPESHSRSDSEKIRVRLLGPEVLDADRFPKIMVKGRYEGTLSTGTFDAHITLRGSPKPLALAVSVRPDGARLYVQGEWEGRLTQLGITPCRALLGALALKDWARLAFRVELEPV
jgi:polyisoprenoid-binding protein YceI